jgi:hypothetical protein
MLFFVVEDLVAEARAHALATTPRPGQMRIASLDIVGTVTKLAE